MGIPTLRDAQFSVVYYCKDGAAVPSALQKAGVGTGSSKVKMPPWRLLQKNLSSDLLGPDHKENNICSHAKNGGGWRVGKMNLLT